MMGVQMRMGKGKGMGALQGMMTFKNFRGKGKGTDKPVDPILEPIIEEINEKGILVQVWDVIPCPPLVARSALTDGINVDNLNNRALQPGFPGCNTYTSTTSQQDITVGGDCPPAATEGDVRDTPPAERIQNWSLVRCCTDITRFAFAYNSAYDPRRRVQETVSVLIMNYLQSPIM